MCNRVVAWRGGGIGVLVVDSGKGQRLVTRLGAFATAEHGTHPNYIGRFSYGFNNYVATLTNLLFVNSEATCNDHGGLAPRVTTLVS